MRPLDVDMKFVGIPFEGILSYRWRLPRHLRGRANLNLGYYVACCIVCLTCSEIKRWLICKGVFALTLILCFLTSAMDAEFYFPFFDRLHVKRRRGVERGWKRNWPEPFPKHHCNAITAVEWFWVRWTMFLRRFKVNFSSPACCMRFVSFWELHKGWGSPHSSK